jgi:arsenate reductase
MPHRVLFLCTGNSARSILAEVIARDLGFVAYSAGSQPVGRVNPAALACLAAHGHDTQGLRSKSWDEFSAIEVDSIITVCDNAAGETCPYWPGKPATLHWGLPDPASVEGEAAQQAAFEQTYQSLKSKLEPWRKP